MMRLDDAAPAKAAPDERPATLGLEVLDELRIGGVALAAAVDLGLDVGLGDLDALDVRDLRQDEQGLDPLLGAGPEFGVEVGLGLLDGGQVGRLLDALPGERAAELVVHDLDFLVHQDLGQLDGRVGHGVLDDPVRERVAGPVEGIRREAVVDVGAQGGDVGEVAHLVDEVVVEIRQDLLAQFLEVHREVGRLAGQGRLAVVLGERHVELGRGADVEADEVRLEARDQALLAQDERHPVRAAAIERLAVTRPDEADDRVVAFLRRPILDRGRGSRSGRAARR